MRLAMPPDAIPPLEIPRGSLVLLVGVAGSGKSTFARRHFRSTEVISSDACRALISDDEADQSATADAFALLNFIVEKRLRRRRIAVVDATNVQAWARALLLEIALRCEAASVAIVLDVPEEVWREQNRGRQRRVDDTVLQQQASDLAATRGALEAEGFARVYVLGSRDAVRAAKVVVEAA